MRIPIAINIDARIRIIASLRIRIIMPTRIKAIPILIRGLTPNI